MAPNTPQQRKSPRPQAAPQSGAARPIRQEAAGVEYWRVERVAQYLDLSPKRVYQLIQEKRLTAVRLSPRNTRVLRRSIEEYLAGVLILDERDSG